MKKDKVILYPVVLFFFMAVSTSLAQEGKSLIDYFRPMEAQSPLVSKGIWGDPNVLPRDTANGLEDATLKDWCYWDGRIVKSDDGRYHIYASRWTQTASHREGWHVHTKGMHAVSHHVMGPYRDMGLTWPHWKDGLGHNVIGLRMHDGRYAIVTSEVTPGEVFVSDSPDGPFELLGQIQVDNNGFEPGLARYNKNGHMSNVKILLRPDGRYMIVARSTAVMISDSGILGPYKIMNDRVYKPYPGLPQTRNEDPTVWYSGGLYHIVYNHWPTKTSHHFTSEDGIRDWKYRGIAFKKDAMVFRYTDGMVNDWEFVERPTAYVEDGHVTHFIFSVIDVSKGKDRGNDKHASKIIVVPFDGEAFDRDMQKLVVEEEKQGFRYRAEWESIRSGYEVPGWFRDAKFGIFVIWGPYAVPAMGTEKYPKYMYYPGRVKDGFNNFDYHKRTYGDHSEFGYKDFIPMFKGEKFNAGEWVSLFKEAGARYVVPIAEYHDGYAMYYSSFTRWNSVDTGPKRDVLGLVAEACRDQGLKFGASSHLANWRGFYSKKDPDWDTSDPEYADLYRKPIEAGSKPSEEFLQTWWNRTTDFIDQYQPDLLWFDFVLDRPGHESLHKPILAYYYNKGLEWGKEVVFQDKNMKYKRFPEDLIVLDIERGRMDTIFKYPWQTDTSVGKRSWGYIKDEDYKSADYLTDELIDIVSKNGCLLLAVGPKADGTIPEEAGAILGDMGKWLNLNGEAVYETRPWKIHGEGPTKVSSGHHSESENKDHVAADIRFTTKGDVLYATSLDWPTDGKFNITSLAEGNPYESRKISSVGLVSGSNRVKWKQGKEGLSIWVRGEKPCEAAYAFRIRF